MQCHIKFSDPTYFVKMVNNDTQWDSGVVGGRVVIFLQTALKSAKLPHSETSVETSAVTAN